MKERHYLLIFGIILLIISMNVGNSLFPEPDYDGLIHYAQLEPEPLPEEGSFADLTNWVLESTLNIILGIIFFFRGKIVERIGRNYSNSIQQRKIAEKVKVINVLKEHKVLSILLLILVSAYIGFILYRYLIPGIVLFLSFAVIAIPAIICIYKILR